MHFKIDVEYNKLSAIILKPPSADFTLDREITHTELFDVSKTGKGKDAVEAARLIHRLVRK